MHQRYEGEPIHTFYRGLRSHVYQYMGIDYGEVHRMKPAKVDYVTNLYPLIDYKVRRMECIELIESARLPVPIRADAICARSTTWSGG